jgi:hypothetical protein
MSEYEQDLAIGRLVRESAERKRALAAMTLELERFQKAFTSLGSALAKNVDSRFNLVGATGAIENSSVLNGIDFGKLLRFLEEYSDLREHADRDAARLKDLGL